MKSRLRDKNLSDRKRPLQPTLSDEVLVSRARRGDQAAFRELVERYEHGLARVITSMIGQGTEVDDLLQEVFIRFYRSIDQYRGDAKVSTYLGRIAINLSLDTLRRRKRWFKLFKSSEEIQEVGSEPFEDESFSVDQKERHVLIHRALEKLPPNQRAVVALRMVEGYSTEETAQILQIPYGTVLSRLNRGLARLRETLASYMEENPVADPQRPHETGTETL